jgi:hypothetical protein
MHGISLYVTRIQNLDERFGIRSANRTVQIIHRVDSQNAILSDVIELNKMALNPRFDFCLECSNTITNEPPTSSAKQEPETGKSQFRVGLANLFKSTRSFIHCEAVSLAQSHLQL